MKKKEPLIKISNQLITDDIKVLLVNRDANFLKCLFVEVNPYLIRVCAANGYYRDLADDVIHETWATFFMNLENFQGRSNIRTYVCGILFNKIRESRRTEGKHVFTEDSETIFSRTFTHEGWWNQKPEDPHKFAELQQASEFVKDCLEGLTERQKAAFIMKEIDGDHSEEICNVLGINVTNLRILIFRAKDKLRQCLDGKISSGEF